MKANMIFITHHDSEGFTITIMEAIFMIHGIVICIITLTIHSIGVQVFT